MNKSKLSMTMITARGDGAVRCARRCAGSVVGGKACVHWSVRSAQEPPTRQRKTHVQRILVGIALVWHRSALALGNLAAHLLDRERVVELD